MTVLMVPFFYILLKAGMFRIDPLEEEVGLDLSHHRGPCYDMTAPKVEDVEALNLHRSHHGVKTLIPIPHEGGVGDKTDKVASDESEDQVEMIADV